MGWFVCLLATWLAGGLAGRQAGLPLLPFLNIFFSWFFKPGRPCLVVSFSLVSDEPEK